MNSHFIIAKIHRAILVDKNEYSEKVTTFNPNLRTNELIFHFSGKSVVHFNGLKLECEPGVVRFLPKGENKEYVVEREERGECIVIYFETDVPVANEAFVCKPPNATAIANLFRKLFSVWVSKGDGYYFECMGLLYKILAELQKQVYIPQSQYDAIKPALQYIHEHFLATGISVPHLAVLCGISESYLKKLFIKKFGLPPVKYIIQLKIHYACDLLRSELYTVTQVAEICGYANAHFFSRQFKEYVGIAPSTFVNKYKSSK